MPTTAPILNAVGAIPKRLWCAENKFKTEGEMFDDCKNRALYFVSNEVMCYRVEV